MVAHDKKLRLQIASQECYSELVARLKTSGIEYEVPRRRNQLWRDRGVPAAAELVVALGSAGVFTAAWKILKEILRGHSSREIAVSYGQYSITIKGHADTEEKALLQEFYDRTVRALAGKAPGTPIAASTESDQSPTPSE